MTHNHLYTDHKNIMARLSRTFTMKTINEADIIEWCQEAETDIIQDVDNMYKFIEVELDIENDRAYLPCNIYKILDVYLTPEDSTSRIDYYKVGPYISVDSSQNYTSIYIDYLGNPVDLKTGIPLIVRGHEIACEAYCTWKLFYQDIIMDKISVDAKNRIEMKMSYELAAAIGTSKRHKDRSDMNREMIIRGNWVPRLANLKLIKNDTIQ